MIDTALHYTTLLPYSALQTEQNNAVQCSENMQYVMGREVRGREPGVYAKMHLNGVESCDCCCK